MLNLLQAENIEKRYADKYVLDDVSVSIPEGSVYGMLGPNGAGKTTFLRIVNRILAPDSGNIFFDGEKLDAKHMQQIGYLPEERGLYRKMKVGEQALYLAQLKGMSKKDATAQVTHWFHRMDIAGWWDKKVEELSKGMQQKVQFMVTVVHRPRLLIFDEPFSGFDPINAGMLKNEILDLRKNGATIIFSTHNMASVEELCDYITLINQSKTVLSGSITDIKDQYKKNVFQCTYSGNIQNIGSLNTGEYEIIENRALNGVNTCKIAIKAGQHENRLLSDLLNLVEVKSFNEVIPTMDEIFISAVQTTQNQNHD